MEYRRVGRSGLRLSVIGLGSWLTMKRHGQDVANALHRTAYENGVNFYDTANVYGGGETEAMVAEALAPFRRDTYVLATKVFFPVGEHPFPGANDRGLSRKHIFEQCHRSLRHLGTEYIDLYQCHRYDPETPLDETCRAMNDLVQHGRILYWGVSQWAAGQIRDAVRLCDDHHWPRPISNQPQYNMLHREAEAEVLPTCGELGLGVVVFSPLAEGILTGKYRPGQPLPAESRAADDKQGQWIRGELTAENLALVERLAGVAKEAGLPMSQMALAWCLRWPELTSCIVGASRPAQLLENLGAADVRLDDSTEARIRSILGKS